MKTIIPFLFVLIACSKNDPKPSFIGTWAYSTSEYSGTFTVSNKTDGMYSITSGSFSYGGTSYTAIPSQFAEVVSGTTQIQLLAQVSTQTKVFKFTAVPSSDFKTIAGSGSSFNAGDGKPPVNPNNQLFTITRK